MKSNLAKIITLTLLSLVGLQEEVSSQVKAYINSSIKPKSVISGFLADPNPTLNEVIGLTKGNFEIDMWMDYSLESKSMREMDLELNYYFIKSDELESKVYAGYMTFPKDGFNNAKELGVKLSGVFAKDTKNNLALEGSTYFGYIFWDINGFKNITNISISKELLPDFFAKISGEIIYNGKYFVDQSAFSNTSVSGTISYVIENTTFELQGYYQAPINSFNGTFKELGNVSLTAKVNIE